MRLPHPFGHCMPVTLKLTVLSCPSVAGSVSLVEFSLGATVVSAGLVPELVSDLLVLPLGPQPSDSSIKSAAQCLSFITIPLYMEQIIIRLAPSLTSQPRMISFGWGFVNQEIANFRSEMVRRCRHNLGRPAGTPMIMYAATRWNSVV
jgi:hypothetical protein